MTALTIKCETIHQKLQMVILEGAWSGLWHIVIMEGWYQSGRGLSLAQRTWLCRNKEIRWNRVLLGLIRRLEKWCDVKAARRGLVRGGVAR